jgi:hypothetical protein
MFWWFEREGELLRVEVVERTPRQYEIRVVDSNGAERVENFTTSQDVDRRHRELVSTITEEGWTGPHGRIA